MPGLAALRMPGLAALRMPGLAARSTACGPRQPPYSRARSLKLHGFLGGAAWPKMARRLRRAHKLRKACYSQKFGKAIGRLQCRDW